MNIINAGLQINFKNHIQCNSPFEHKHSQRDSDIISEEIKKLLQKQVITQCDINHGDYFSSMFVRPKNEGSFRTILNLKYLNEECFTCFKMETIKQVIHMITPNCYLASLDIKDPFCTVPIYAWHKKYLKFLNACIAYQFEVMPSGCLDAMRVFTKILKPLFSCLREQSHSSVIYVDDSLLAGDTCRDCLDNVHETKLLLEVLGFHIHPIKYVFLPAQVITFLEFEMDTVTMTISLTNAKKSKIKDLCVTTLSNSTLTIHQVASLLGNITASFEAVPYGCLHYQYLEQNKIMALREARGNFEKP